MQRRDLIKAGLALPLLRGLSALSLSGAPLAAGALPARGTPFDEQTVPALARRLAAAAYQPPVTALTPSLQRISYDQYRDIRFDPRKAIWRDTPLPFQLQFFHRGFLFKERVDIALVADGIATPLVYSPSQFSFGAAPVPSDQDVGYAGMRIHAPINRPDYFDEICTFLGASYFRAVAKGQNYGLSARGLALKTGDPGPEEFPVFKQFWVEQPGKDASAITVHALLDSPSAAAAMRFVISPGDETVFDTQMRLYPRVDLDRAGIAPLTSMYEFDAGDRIGVDDYRPAVHDSDGLAMLNGRGEQIWRPLRNPAQLQVSAFEDANPKGFGLMQRKRAYAEFADIEANYQRRPSLWVEPVGDWGKGAVTLVEIPTGDEYHDNIVAFWRPAQPLRAGSEHRFDYRLHWCTEHAWQPELATVVMTRIGAAPQPGTRLIVIDLAGGRLSRLNADARVDADVWASSGSIANAVAHANPQTGGWRISFELTPQHGKDVELHARAHDDRGPLSETWLYRWTP
ncbi:glucan biosynthesis protein [Pseudoxanthomonas dokdonensis]|uniref:glucan biosynthesis protein n=1 Tax=Pseudoxanthomonas dokdonensis TaxID=344882 RepID=UPI000ACD1BE3|nr:glucan biosynthesis protein G [Pseudoxanthomonas dokdonensis]